VACPGIDPPPPAAPVTPQPENAPSCSLSSTGRSPTRSSW
jgi:hypothetical protein